MTSYTAYDQNWFYDPQYLRGIGPQQEGYGYPMQIDQTGMVSAQAAPYPPMPSGAQIPVQPGIPVTPGTLPMEQSYIENILRLNLGKKSDHLHDIRRKPRMECQNIYRHLRSSRQGSHHYQRPRYRKEIFASHGQFRLHYVR